MQRLLILCAALLYGLFLPTASFAAKYHVTTQTQEVHRSGAIPHYYDANNMWIYTKYDNLTKYVQVYFEYLPATLTTTDKLTEVRLTDSAFDKSLAKWGKVDVDVDYYATRSTASPDTTCSGGYLYYYLGDPDGNGNQLYMGCLVRPGAASPTVAFDDAPITDYAFPRTGYDIENYDTSANVVTAFRDSSLNNHSGPYIVLTTSSGGMHLVIHEEGRVYGDTTGMRRGLIEFDTSDSFTWGADTYEYHWKAFTANQGLTGKKYKSPSFDRGLNKGLITFLVKGSTDTYYQVGTMPIWGMNDSSGGVYDVTLTNISKEIRHPQFADGSYQNIFFETVATSSTKGRFEWLKLNTIDTSGSVPTYTVSDWCDWLYVISDSSYTRTALDTRHDSRSYYNLTYARTQADGNNDIYATRIIGIPLCTTASTTALSTETEFVGVFAEAADDTMSSILIALVPEVQLTCSDDNYFPKFQTSEYRKTDFSVGVSPRGYTDVIMLRQKYTGGDQLINIYDTEHETRECKNNCYQNADRSAITDANGYEDGDDVKDSCEEVPCTADSLTATPAGDFDSDSVVNAADNCPCSYNPTQYDPDGDLVGEAYEASDENGCDNCPGLSNPADIDNNSDGSYNPLDTDYRQTDSDNDGYGDSCDTQVDACGEADADGDSVNDDCDNCVAADNSDQTDSDSDGIGDACDNCTSTANDDQTDSDGDDIGDACEEAESCVVSDTSSSSSNTLYLSTSSSSYISSSDTHGIDTDGTDTDGDGIIDSCDNCPYTKNTDQSDIDGDGTGDICDTCKSTQNSDQLDTDGDHVGDICDNCAELSNDDQADADGDNVGDACEASTIIVDTPEPAGDYSVSGGLLSGCSLNASAVPESPSSAMLTLIMAGLLMVRLRLNNRRAAKTIP